MKKLLATVKRIRKPKKATHLAVLFKGSKVTMKAWNNRKKTRGICARLGYPRATAHAEVAVVLDFLKNHSSKELRKQSILVMRYHADGELQDSKPCKRCMGFLSNVFRVRKIVWMENGKVVKQRV